MQERAARSVVEALLPVLDDIHAAREHGDLEGGPFASIADKLESSLGKFGLERYGAVGEEFDPALHEALMHTAWPQDGSVDRDRFDHGGQGAPARLPRRRAGPACGACRRGGPRVRDARLHDRAVRELAATPSSGLPPTTATRC